MKICVCPFIDTLKLPNMCTAVLLLLLQIQLAYSLLPSSNRTSALVPCLPDQALALLRLRQSFSTTNHSICDFRSWMSGTDCCRWESVRCGDADGRVTTLDLGDCNLQSGGLDPALFSLTSLKRLNLGGNDFNRSQLPSAGFEQLSKLTYLNLSDSWFTGQIPISIGSLTNLVSLDLSISFNVIQHVDRHKYLLRVYSDPYWGMEEPNFERLIANLSNLRELHLSFADMYNSRAKWCNALAISTPKLKILRLPFCSLTGPICQSLSSLQSLSVVDLQYNSLSGPVPEFFADLPLLSVLQLSKNNLDGWISPRIFNNRKLTNIDISYNFGISGNLPSFSRDSSLTTLLVSSTNFSGSVSSSISNLKSLEKLGISASGPSEDLPSSIGNRKSLNFLEVSGFNLVGSMPSWITNLTSLTELKFCNCGLSGSLPPSIGNLKNLAILTLYKCSFSGNVPMHILNLTQLNILHLESNNFMGRIELTSFWKLPKLFYLNLSDNKLSVTDGALNSSLKIVPRLRMLFLASCNISSFPNALKIQDGIRTLDLSNNQIHGAIPRWAWKTWEALHELDLSNNKFSSIEYDTMFPLYAEIINLSSNSFEGPIPIPQGNALFLDYSNNRFSSVPLNSIRHLCGTEILMLSRNNISGEIPSSLCIARSLQHIDLSYNRLSGPIPSCLMEDSDALKILNLKSNQLSGELPHGIKDICAFEALYFSDNQIGGKLPRSLAACKYLEVLDVGNNQIIDSFPCWMSMLPKLQVLVLKFNMFFGQLGPALDREEKSCNFRKLRIINLASNNFSGILPEEWFRELKSMRSMSRDETLVMETRDVHHTTYEFVTTITHKGHDITFFKILKALVLIDISYNAFHGSIPKAIGELVLLHGLNMSNNDLTGSIPTQLGGLGQLESLDLSSNELSGVIPNELASLNFLSTLNLSNNSLVGKIPESSQFSTFPNSSFLGNAGLCGPPLSKQCHMTKPNVVPQLSKKDYAEILLFLFAGLGFGVGFAIVITVIWGICIRKLS